MDISPSNLYHSFCLGMADAIEEAPEKLGSYAAWAAIFNAASALGKYCGITVTAGTAEGTIEAGAVAGGEITVAILVCFLAGYLCFNYNEITGSLNKVFYDLGKITAECVITALIGYFEAAVAGVVLTNAAFQNITRQASIYIKRVWNGTALHVEVEEILLCFGGTTSLAEILKQHLTDKAAAYMAKMQALNALPDAAMRAAYNFIKEHSTGIGVTLRELRLIIKNTGKMAGEKLKALTDWVKKKPAHYDKIEAEGLELLQEEEAELAEKGLLDKVDEALQKESEGLADDAALGLDDVEAVIEKVIEGVFQTKKLYRVMSNEEYQALMNNGKFTLYDMAMEDKWFATTIEDAEKWAQYFYPDGIYKMVEIEVNVESLSRMYYNPCLDNIGPAYCSPLDILNDAIKSIKGVK